MYIIIGEEKYRYIREEFNTLILRDIKQKYRIKNQDILQNISSYMMDNISNMTSPNNITKVLNSNNNSISDKTVNKYIEYMCRAFLFYKVNRFDIRGKKYLSSLNKYYLADHSFKYALLGTKSMDYGRVYENIVLIELLRRGYDVFIGTLYNKEIGFVAIKQNEKIYIQVSDYIGEETTFKREVESLLKINDAYPKILIANTRHDTYQYEGVQIIDLANWLIGKEK